MVNGRPDDSGSGTPGEPEGGPGSPGPAGTPHYPAPPGYPQPQWPPPGAPGETMHTLEEIHDRTDPRTPISSLPYTITNSGSYYVVSNLHSTTDGIVIETSGVTVDLMGFSITGDGDNGDYGIHVAGATNAPIEDLVIKGGRISGFSYGFYCQYMNNSRIEHLVVFGNSSYGIILNGMNGQCDGNSILGNQVSENATVGIYLVFADGNRIEANHVSGTSGAGTTYGIRTAVTTDNFILKNTCVGQVNNFALDPDDTYGPVVSAGGPLGSTGDEAHPWANFSR